MRRFQLIFCLLLLISCVKKEVQQDTMATQMEYEEPFPFEIEPLGFVLTRAFNNPLSNEVLYEYDEYLQRHLEKEYDGRKVKFITKDKSLKVEFLLRESFKIVEKNIYCREYSQHVEYMSEIIDNIGVACRQEGNVWENLVLLTK